MDRNKGLKEDIETKDTMALAMREKDRKLWDAASVMMCLAAEDATLATEVHRRHVDVDGPEESRKDATLTPNRRHIDVDGPEEPREETQSEQDRDPVSVAEEGAKKRKRETVGQEAKKRSRTSTVPRRTSACAAPKTSWLPGRAGRSSQLTSFEKKKGVRCVGLRDLKPV